MTNFGGEPTRTLLTHACGCEYVGKDGTMRRMVTQRYEDGTISFHIATYWDGDDKEPVTTSVRMGVEAYSAFLEMLNVFAVDRERFRNPDYMPPNVELTGAAPLYGAASSDRRERG